MPIEIILKNERGLSLENDYNRFNDERFWSIPVTVNKYDEGRKAAVDLDLSESDKLRVFFGDVVDFALRYADKYSANEVDLKLPDINKSHFLPSGGGLRCRDYQMKDFELTLKPLGKSSDSGDPGNYIGKYIDEITNMKDFALELVEKGYTDIVGSDEKYTISKDGTEIEFGKSGHPQYVKISSEQISDSLKDVLMIYNEMLDEMPNISLKLKLIKT